MKILVVSLFLPTQQAGHAGGRFVFEALKELSRNHEVHLATRVEKGQLNELEPLRRLCKQLYVYPYDVSIGRGVWSNARLLFNYIGFSFFADKLIDREQFDLVQVEWVETAVLIRKKCRLMVLDAHDVITKPGERRLKQSAGFLRPFRYIAYRLIRCAETAITRRFTSVITRSESDRDYLLGMNPDLAISVVPHPAGLDLTDKVIDRQKNSILFLASYRYRPVNVDAAIYFYKRVFPTIRKCIPDARFIIAGYGPPEQLISIGRNDPSVIVTGFVSDIDACYKKAAVFVAPILVGGGIIVKILDAMAAGVPVVTTSYGNEGIGAEPGQHLLVEDDPERFALGVLKLLGDPDYADRIGKKGKDYISANYGREAVFLRLEQLYVNLRKS